jgi:hypothetical protein
MCLGTSKAFFMWDILGISITYGNIFGEIMAHNGNIYLYNMGYIYIIWE